MAATSGEKPKEETTFVSIALCIFAFALMIFVSTGNIMTLLAIARTKVLRTLANIYVASLAVADLIIGLGFSLVGIFMLPEIKLKYFDQNMNMCVFMQGLTIGSLFVSSFHMTLISCDRYIYITRPYIYPRVFTKTNILVVIAGIWVFGIFMMIVPQFTYTDSSDCDIVLTLPLWYLFYLTAGTYAINVVISVVFYCQILLAALRQRNAIRATTLTIGAIANNPENVKGKKDSAQSAKIGWKSIKFFFTIFGFFFVCSTPCLIAITMDLYASVDEQLVRTTTLIVMLNSGMNFIIYAVLNRQFKRAFSDIIHCRQSSQ